MRGSGTLCQEKCGVRDDGPFVPKRGVKNKFVLCQDNAAMCAMSGRKKLKKATAF